MLVFPPLRTPIPNITGSFTESVKYKIHSKIWLKFHMIQITRMDSTR